MVTPNATAFLGLCRTLPSRILDASPGQEENGIHLVETCGELVIFITLSHCWGQVKFIQTTKTTLEDQKKNMPFDELPLAFQNAIEITRGLGMQSLWIDSLCTIQDDLSHLRLSRAE